jgi:hypothetical protein
MAELEPTKALIELLADIDDRKVYTEPLTFAAYRNRLDGLPEVVSEMAWTVEHAGWAVELADDPVWHLTPLGREVLDRGAP